MKKSFKVLLLAVMVLCLAASAGFAADRAGVKAIKEAAGTAFIAISKDCHAASDDALTSLVMTLALAASGDSSSNKEVLLKAAQTISGDAASAKAADLVKAAYTLGEEVSADTAIVKSDYKAPLLQMAGNLAKVTGLTEAAIKVYADYFKSNLYTTGDVDKVVGNEMAAFYTVASKNSGAFTAMLPYISDYFKTELNKTSITAANLTPKAMLKFISDDLQFPFVSIDIKVTATGGTNTSSTLKVAAASSDIYKLIVDYGATVSFDFGTSSADVVSAEVSSGSLASKDYIYSVTAPVTSGDSIDVTFGFASGDSSVFAFVVKVIASGDSVTETTETYLLKVSDITLTPANAVSNTAKLISADTDNYSATLDLTNLNSTASGDWGSAGTITVSSDYLGGSFSITVSTDAKLVNVYVQNGTAWDELDTDEVSGDVITPNTVGTYKAVLSADLIASNDKTVSGDAYFAFNVIIASVDESSKGDETKTVSPEDAPTSVDANGNKVLDENSAPVANKFSSGTTASSALINQFFTTATALPVLSESRITALLESIGYTADDLGDETDGYKAIAFELPYTLVAGQPYFALLTDNDNGTGTKTYLGFGYIPEKLGGTKTMVILFKLLRNPNNPKEFMSFPAGKYFVGATNDGTSSASNNTRALFMTANGETFNIKSNEAKLLQGQTTSGTAEPYEESSGDETTDEVSSHGSSSGCDAGFGALALLAVAGALAARKVRK